MKKKIVAKWVFITQSDDLRRYIIYHFKTFFRGKVQDEPGLFNISFETVLKVLGVNKIAVISLNGVGFHLFFLFMTEEYAGKDINPVAKVRQL